MKKTFIAVGLIAIGFIAGLTIRGGVYNKGESYDAWTSTGMHLAIYDNGTEDPEDDYVFDWEDNRDFEITVKD